jgi:hypothetical protein
MGLVILLAGLVGCPGEEPESDDDDVTSEPATTAPPINACIPGQQLACPCVDGGQGVQVCALDGSSFEPCQCDPTPLDDSTTTTGSVDSTSTGPADSSGGGSSSSSTTDATDSTSTTSGSDVCEEYRGTVGTECDPWLQDCPVGEKCMPWADDGGSSWNATRCSPIDPVPAQPGDECTVEGNGTSGLDSCDLGSMCMNVDPETNTGTCVAMCTGCPDAPVCDEPGTLCSISNEGVLVLCRPACDPLAQSCPAGQGCYPSGDAFFCAADASGMGGAYGQPCMYINGCNPGLMCLAGAATPGCMTAGCCTEVCDLDDPLGDAQCTGEPQGQTCQAWYEEDTAPPGYEDVGACALP